MSTGAKTFQENNKNRAQELRRPSKIIENETEEDQKIIAEDFAKTQSEELAKNGFEQLHFYTLNESEIMINISNHLGFQIKNNIA